MLNANRPSLPRQNVKHLEVILERYFWGLNKYNLYKNGDSGSKRRSL